MFHVKEHGKISYSLLTYHIVLAVESKCFGHAKITDLGEGLRHEENVSGGEIAVDELPTLQVAHTLGHLVHEL